MTSSNLTDKDRIIDDLKSQIILLEKELQCFKENKSPIMVDVGTQYESLTLADEFNIYKENNERADISIADMIRETSESFLSNSGYTYEEKTGLYYHSKSGFYYDPNNLLFYDPKNGIYYSYDVDTNEYKYHSQDNVEELVKLNNEMLWCQGYQHRPPQRQSNKSETTDENTSKPVPCIRLINENTARLEIITRYGGSIGSDPIKNHTISIPHGDNGREISLKIIFDMAAYQYQIFRDKSDNAEGCAIMNDCVITEVPKSIDHHSKLVINKQPYLIHIHDDYKTCDWCEPGQVMGKLSSMNTEDNNQNELEISKFHSKRVVDQLKVKYGLKNGKASPGFWRKPNPNNQSKYIDRSLIRRNKEKEEEKKVEKKESENVGMKMMMKMGWNLNEPIGKSGIGIMEPIDVYQRLNARAGIGCEDAINVHVETDSRLVNKLKTRNATQRRYNSLFAK